MLQGNPLDDRIRGVAHMEGILAEIAANLGPYLASFEPQSRVAFAKAIEEYEKEREAYRDFLDLEALEEYEDDPNAFKSMARRQCPIVRRCLMSQDEAMKAYKRAFYDVSGRALLSPIRHIAEFGAEYMASFDDELHEATMIPADLELGPLDTDPFGCPGVIGYGIQSTLLYALYARGFAHRSQNATWSLYFLSGRKDFGLADGSEFLIVRGEGAVCEQNFVYPPDLFAFYSLKLYLMLRDAFQEKGYSMDPAYRYVYLSTFSDHVADTHRSDIHVFTRSSDYVERQPYF
jgi:hypothetical protein